MSAHETKTPEQLAIELMTTSKCMPHGEADARRLLDQLRREWETEWSTPDARPGTTDYTRQVLGSTDQQPQTAPAAVSRTEVLREASEVAVSAARACGDSETGQYAASVAAGIGKELRRMADEAEAGTPTP